MKKKLMDYKTFQSSSEFKCGEDAEFILIYIFQSSSEFKLLAGISSRRKNKTFNPLLSLSEG